MNMPVEGGLRFSVLGPVRAWLGNRELDLGSPQQRAVLAALLLRGKHAVSAEEIVDGVWGEEPPPAAVSVVRTYTSRLRKVLEADRNAGEPPRVLVSVSGGYELRIPDNAVDVRVNDQRIAAARKARVVGDLPRAAELLHAALEDWGGIALTGIPGPLAESERARLADARLSVLETRLEVDLELGRHDELVTELTMLVAEHPLRERLCRLLMLGLYRSGRQAEALAVYSDTRRILVQEVGVEPGRDLKELHARVLAADPSLALSSHNTAPQLPAVKPQQLPAAIPDFTGRKEELGQLAQVLAGSVDTTAAAVVVVAGMGGVGKTALAVQAAHVVRDHFPDGQLYADLHITNGHPVSPSVILAGFLRALGATEGKLPSDLDELSALFRSTLAQRRVLIILDNAHDTEQIRTLLPGSSACAVLVTSRSGLAALPATARVHLGGFTSGTALDLLARIAGESRVHGEMKAALRVTEICDGLPLAVRVVASRLAVRPRWTVADLAERLADEQQRLSQLRTESLAVESSFRFGYAQLTAEQAHAFRLLSLPNLADIPLSAAAAVLGLPRGTAEGILESLVDVGMLGSQGIERYRYHDLVRLFARQQAEREESSSERQAALVRLLDSFHATARAAYSLLRPGSRGPETLIETRADPMPLADQRAALVWASRELAGIFAVISQVTALVQEGPSALAADLLFATEPLCAEDFRFQEVLPASHAVVRAAQDSGDRRAEGRARYILAHALMFLGEREKAHGHASAALALSQETADKVVQAMAHDTLGAISGYLGDAAKGIEHCEHALAISRELKDIWLEEYALGNIIQGRLDLGQIDESLLDAARRTVSLAEDAGDQDSKSHSLFRLGQVLLALGRVHEAIGVHRQGLEVIGINGPRFQQVAHLIYLARALREAGHSLAAAKNAERAVSVAREIGFQHFVARGLRPLGDALHDLGQTDRARACWVEARDILTQLKSPTDDLDNLIAATGLSLAKDNY